jgi:hypothetical protein
VRVCFIVMKLGGGNIRVHISVVCVIIRQEDAARATTALHRSLSTAELMISYCNLYETDSIASQSQLDADAVLLKVIVHVLKLRLYVSHGIVTH